MKNIIIPDIFKRRILRAFFTRKRPGGDVESISQLSGIEGKNIYTPIQKHTDRLHILCTDTTRKVADAVITRRKNMLIGVMVADCVPILLYDPTRMVCAAVHAGWKGTASGIVLNTVKAMIHEFHSNPADIVMAAGPSIRWCCYTVGADVLHAVRSATGEGDYFEKRGDTICLDLATANRQQALKTGMIEENIWMSDECTYCYPEKYFSYRFSRGATGRQGGFIGMFTDSQ